MCKYDLKRLCLVGCALATQLVGQSCIFGESTEWREGRQRMYLDSSARLMPKSDPWDQEYRRNLAVKESSAGEANRVKYEQAKVNSQIENEKWNEQFQEGGKEKVEAEDPLEKERRLMEEEEAATKTFRAQLIIRQPEQPQSVPVVPLDIKPIPFVVTGGGLPRLYAPGFRIPYFDVTPDFSVSESFNDNIFLRSGKGDFLRESDWITSFSTRIGLSHGSQYSSGPDETYMNFTYNPTYQVFQERPKENGLNHVANLAFGRNFSKLSLYGIQAFSAVTGGEVDSGDLFNRRIFTSMLSGHYDYSPKTSVELNNNIVFRDYDHGFGSLDTKVEGALNYKIFPRLTIGTSGGVGMVDNQISVDERYQRLSVRGVYLVSDALYSFMEVGADYREYEHSTNNNLSYVVNSGTGIDFVNGVNMEMELKRYIQNSNSFVNQNQEITGFSARVSKRILDFSPTITGGYEHTDYRSTSSDVIATKSDDYIYISPGVNYGIKEGWDMYLNYTYRRNFSSNGISDFDNNVISFGSSLAF
jgi:hypothetical protein